MLDIGCGVGYIVIYIVKKGLRVFGIDVIDHHLAKANRNIKAENLKQQVSAQKIDYYYLDRLQDNSIDTVYTIETLIHTIDPKQALQQFYQVLKLGGSIILHKYNHAKFNNKEPATINKTTDSGQGTNNRGTKANSYL